jgi:hypothetical protein
MSENPLLPNPGKESPLTGEVPSGVPSLFHSTGPSPEDSAAKKSRPFEPVRDLG